MEEEVKILAATPTPENEKRLSELHEQIKRLQSITVAHLLSHTSGLGKSKVLYECFGDDLGYGPVITEHHEREELINTFLDKQPISEPGEF